MNGVVFKNIRKLVFYHLKINLENAPFLEGALLVPCLEPQLLSVYLCPPGLGAPLLPAAATVLPTPATNISTYC